MERRYQILAVAPNHGTTRLLEECAQTRTDVRMDVFVGSLQRGVEIVRSETAKRSYDAVIARGETAELIRSVTPLPVIDIQISFYDILQAVKLAENFHERFMIVGFRAVTDNARMLRDLLQTDWEIVTIRQEAEADQILSEAWKEGFRLVVSGVALGQYFKKYGFNFIQITTGAAGVADAIETAVKSSTVFRHLQEERNLYKELVIGTQTEVLLFDEDGKQVLSTLKVTDPGFAASYAGMVLRTNSFTEGVFPKVDEDDKVVVRQSLVKSKDHQYYAFYFTQVELPFQTKPGDVGIYTREAAVARFLQHQNENILHWREKDMNLEEISSSAYPVIFFGEGGVGKMQIAATIYTGSSRTDNKFYMINMQSMTDRLWEYLTTSSESPLFRKGWTLFLRDIGALPPERLTTLEELVYNSLQHTENKFIFSAPGMGESTRVGTIAHLVNRLNCIVLHILPLRERKEELEQLASIYLNSYNVEFAKQVSGFTKDAFECIKEYDWPGNLVQFKRVLMQLVQASTMPYIRKDDVLTVLSGEPQYHQEGGKESLDLTKTLDEINYEIAKRVVAEIGNQSRAAEQLGICRTTLWRILNRNGGQKPGATRK